MEELYDLLLADDVDNLTVDTAMSTATMTSTTTASIKIELTNGGSQIIANQTFPAIIAGSTIRIADANSLSSWMRQYPHAERMGVELNIEGIDETAGTNNTFFGVLRFGFAPIGASGVMWSAPCYVDPESGIYSVNDCVFGGT